MNLPEGHSLQNAKYYLKRVIGQGGFGITYLGVWNTEVQGQLGKVRTEVPVCVKEYFFKDYCYRDNKTSQVLVHSETGKILFDKFKEKLIKEAKILSEVHHPFIVNVLEVFEENNTAYIVMEYISGCSLKYMLDKEGVLPEKTVLRYVSQVSQALEFVHQKNILHLDIKPSNILIDKNNNARLIDFGVSKRYDIEQQETSTTMLALSKGFAPVEQYDNEGTVNFSPCPDIYSLGATMYNLLTGVVPTESILRATRQLVKPSELNSDITPQTEAVILTAMQVNPIHRYQTIKAMINELDIPSYFEETTNFLDEEADNQLKEKDEETEIYSESKDSQELDEDQTNIRQTEELPVVIRKKKNRRRVLIPAAIFLIAFLAAGLTYMLDFNKTQGANQVTDMQANALRLPGLQPIDNETDTTDLQPTENGDIQPFDNNNTQSSQNDVYTTANIPQSASTDLNPPTLSTQNASQQMPDAIENTPSQTDINTEYNALISSGKAKVNEKKYTDAKADFEKARTLRLTEEVIRLLDDTQSKEEEELVRQRIALYEPLATFGNLTIVKKLSNNRWGAIDNKGTERIPCQYLRVAPSGANRAFETGDHHYDIYDSQGEVKGKGLEDY
ncbi:MAG: serine/threonine protein kinase [Tannerella sp.]|jgi:serine/threonine-protein kinase|nr:serine/threonine protein kinase [Tannerella sp.]